MKRFKEFVKKNKAKLIIGGGIVVSGVLLYLGIKHKVTIHGDDTVDSLKRIVSIPGRDLPIPETGKALGVFEYFSEDNHTRCIFSDTFAWDLGKLGEMLINDLEMNPDLPVAITLEYCSN